MLAAALAAGVRAEGTAPCRSPLDVCFAPDGRRAYAVNHTAGSVSVIDVAGRRRLGEIAVGDRPVHAVVSPDGTRLFVSTYGDGRITVVDLDRGRVARSFVSGDGPYGLARSADGGRVYAVNALGDEVAVLDAVSGRAIARVGAGRDPRYVAEVPGTDRLVVSGGLRRSVTLVSAASGEVVGTVPMREAAVLRQVACTSDGRWAFVAHLVSRDGVVPVQAERGWIHANGFSVFRTDGSGTPVAFLLDRLLDGAANPWGVALTPDDAWLCVTLAGVHEVAIVRVPDLLRLAARAGEGDVERYARDVELLSSRGLARRVPSGGLGPRGASIPPGRNELWVANYFSDAVTVLSLPEGEVLATIALSPPAPMTLERRGEMLFNDARLCFQRWFSCASCHQEDATVDGLNWDLPNDGLGNPKNVKSLHDAIDTPPAMWSGVRADLDAAVAAGQRFLGFLPDPDNHRALTAYLASLRRASKPERRHDLRAVRRGERIFRRARCHACHPPPRYADGLAHDLGLRGPEDLRDRFDTPSLRDCYRTAPYLHDGRARTLRDVFTIHYRRGRHGALAGYSPAEIDDLVAYLRTL